GIGSILLGYAVSHIHLYSLLFLAGIGAMSVAYSIPMIPYKGKWVGFRQLPGTKIFHIALVWTLSSVCLPVCEMYMDGLAINIHLIQTLCILMFIVLLMSNLPFEIRDIQQDSYYHL